MTAYLIAMENMIMAGKANHNESLAHKVIEVPCPQDTVLRCQ